MIIITILTLIALHRKTALYKARLPACHFSTTEYQGTFFGLPNLFLVLRLQNRRTQIQMMGLMY